MPKMYPILLDECRAAERRTRVIEIIWNKQQEDKGGFVVALMLIRSVFWDFAAVISNWQDAST